MATFSTNQVRQLYVVTNLKEGPVDHDDEVGTLSVHETADGSIYFLYRGVDGVSRTDIIVPFFSQVVISAPKGVGRKSFKVILDPNVNGGDVIPGQDYLLRIAFKQHIGISGEDQYFKYGAVRGTSQMAHDPSYFYWALYESLVRNFQRELTPLLAFELDGEFAKTTINDGDGGTFTVTARENGLPGNKLSVRLNSVTAGSDSVNLNSSPQGTEIVFNLTAASATVGGLASVIDGNPSVQNLIGITDQTDSGNPVVPFGGVTLSDGKWTGLFIEELPQPWILGKMEDRGLNFTIQCDTIHATDLPFNINIPGVYIAGEELIWGVVTLDEINYGYNGHEVADLEYFCMGERGDIYRGINFPNNITTQYLVDPNKHYCLFEIQYGYLGNILGGEVVAPSSPKSITFVVPLNMPVTGDLYETLNNIDFMSVVNLPKLIS